MSERSRSLAEKIVVTVDPDFETLVPSYLENRQCDLHRIEAALEEGDYSTIESLGHNMKGSGGTYGLQDITDIGLVLERAAKEGNLPKIQQSIAALRNYLEHLEVVYGSAQEAAYSECG